MWISTTICMKNLAANLLCFSCGTYLAKRGGGKLATALSVFCLILVRRGLKGLLLI